MNISRFAVATFAAFALSGCSTLSFAPPSIDTQYPMKSVEQGTCTVNGDTRTKIPQNVAGAIMLIDNFQAGYRCAAREAANGRQSFEVPSFLALVAAGIGGPLYGLTENQQLAAAGYSAVMGRANSYYAPKEKADVLRAAIDGVLCVQNAAAGYDFFDADAGDPVGGTPLVTLSMQDQQIVELIDTQLAELGTRLTTPGLTEQDKAAIVVRQRELNDLRIDLVKQMATRSLSSSIKINASLAYYLLVKDALFGVDNVLVKRLSDSGSFDPTAISSEISELTRQEVEAENRGDELRDAKNAASFVGNVAQAQVSVELDALHARLQKCVVRAKMT